MMKKQHARLGILGSLVFHSALFGVIGWAVSQPKVPESDHEITTISIEMMAALLEQPEAATTPEPTPDVEEQENRIEEVKEPDTIPEPLPPEPIAQAPVEKPKEKPKPLEKPKTRPKEKTKVDKAKVKALEKDKEVKTGIVAKQPSNTPSKERIQAGIVNGTTQTTNPQGNAKNNSIAGASASELAAYKALLRRTLQRQADNSYPQRERMMRKMGVVTLSITLSPLGQVVNASIVSSSGNNNLDMAAARAAKSTNLNSPLPKGFPTIINVPIQFRLN